MAGMLKDKLCKTCISRYPEIENLTPKDTRPHRTPVIRCLMDHDIRGSYCEDYRNLWTGRPGKFNEKPTNRPEL